MMFAFLPMMAFMMLPLYRRPRRYRVKQLLFFLHSCPAVLRLC
jgi:hypothetical protein